MNIDKPTIIDFTNSQHDHLGPTGGGVISAGATGPTGYTGPIGPTGYTGYTGPSSGSGGIATSWFLT